MLHSSLSNRRKTRSNGRAAVTRRFHVPVGLVFQLLILCSIEADGWTHSTRWDKRESQKPLLESDSLKLDDWAELEGPLKQYLRSYDHTIMCTGEKSTSSECQQAVSILAIEYFTLAVNQTMMGLPSKVWRRAETGALYGSMLVMDSTDNDEKIPEILHKSKLRREQCSKQILGVDVSEYLRYVRIHIGVGEEDSATDAERKSMLNQFVTETMQLYLCSEYQMGDEHVVAIFPNKKAGHHFERFGFEKLMCGDDLYQLCNNKWFIGRCLMTTLINRENCQRI